MLMLGGVLRVEYVSNGAYLHICNTSACMCEQSWLQIVLPFALWLLPMLRTWLRSFRKMGALGAPVPLRNTLHLSLLLCFFGRIELRGTRKETYHMALRGWSLHSDHLDKGTAFSCLSPFPLESLMYVEIWLTAHGKICFFIARIDRLAD